MGSVCIPGVYILPMMLISLVSNIDPNGVVDPTGVDTRAHSVATHDSMESLSEVAASKVCWEWQHLKSVGCGSI